MRFCAVEPGTIGWGVRSTLMLCLAIWAAGCASTPPFEDLELPRGAEAGRIPIEAFFADGPIQNPKLSPNGRFVAAFRTLVGKRNIVKFDLETGSISPVTALAENELIDFWWANDERLLISVAFSGGLYRKLVAVDSDGSNLKDFAQRNNAREARPVAASNQYGDRLVSLLPEDREHVLVAYAYYPAATWIASDVYKLNIYTGRSVAIAHATANPYRWFADSSGTVRIGYGQNRNEGFFVYRKSEADDWQRVGPAANRKLDELSFIPLGAAQDPSQLYVLSRHESDRYALYRYDIERGEFLEKLFSHPQVDVTGPLVESLQQPGVPSRLLGVGYTDDFVRVHWLDDRARTLMDKVDAVLEGSVNTIISRSSDESRLLIHARSDRQPNTYYVFDRAKNELTRLGSSRPSLDPEQLAAVLPVRYSARDGLEIHGYLALPREAEAQVPREEGELPATARPVPLIVNPHGGPWARDTREFDAELQFFASRGWAVFRPNFRGSEGFGLEFQARGYRQWGLAMQDDVTDGVRWLIDRGIVDPDRVCIYGGSYGGYASLTGLVKTPDLYACGATFAGVSDLDAILRDREFYVNSGSLATRLGDRRQDAEALRTASPIDNVRKIRVPVFIAHGVEDRVVRVDHSQRMADALRAAEKPHHLLLLEGQPHGFYDESARIRYYRNLEAFLYPFLTARQVSSAVPESTPPKASLTTP